MNDFEYKLEYTNRKRTISITIKPSKEIIVKAPKRTPITEIERFIAEKNKWINNKLKYFEQNYEKYLEKSFVEGELHQYLGNNYVLKVIPADIDKVSIIDGNLVVCNSRIKNQFSTKIILKLWYLEQATSYIKKRSKELFELFISNGVVFPEISFKKTKSRWGSCSSNGKVAFNPELIKQHPKSIDYVIIHEFCHLLEHNHGKNFYRILEQKMPDWKIWKKKLSTTAG